MKEALIIFLIGLILGTNYSHSAPLDIRSQAQIKGVVQQQVISVRATPTQRQLTPVQAQAKEIKYLLEQSEELVEDASETAPAGWPGMNLIAEIQDMQDQLNAALPTATKAQADQILTELQRLNGALKLLNEEP